MLLRISTLLFILFVSCKNTKSQNEAIMKEKNVQSTDTTDWFSNLNTAQYQVLKEKATEAPFTGEYNLFFEAGTYVCAACKTPLFESNTKFDGHCGWPSFDKAIKGRVKYITDNSHGMKRTEIVCAKCGGHLGHIFDDGPTATGKRYCVNSLSLTFVKDSLD